MMDKTPHRPPEQDTLERYVLGQLPEHERAEVDRLIAQDLRWREALEHEQRLAAGVRRLGRDRMKRRLRSALREVPDRVIPWPRVIAVAASVIIIVGVVAINQWYRLHDQSGTEISPTISDIRPEASSERPTDMPRDASLSERKKEPAPTREDESGITSDQKRDDDQPPQLHKLRGTAAAEPPKEKAEVSLSFPSERDGEWTQAQLYRSAPLVNEEAEKLQSAEELRRARGALEDQRPLAGRIKESPEKTRTSAVTVDQRLFNSLAPSIQALQRSSTPSQIPVLVEQRRDTLLIILYPAELFDRDELQQASVEFPNDDSLVITIARQQIGLRLPPRIQQRTSPSSNP